MRRRTANVSFISSSRSYSPLSRRHVQAKVVEERDHDPESAWLESRASRPPSPAPAAYCTHSYEARGPPLSKEQVWQESFSYSSQLCNNRATKKYSIFFHFKLKSTKKVPWIEAERAAVIHTLSGDGFNLDVDYGAADLEHSGLAGLNHAQLFAGHWSGDRGTSIITYAFEKGLIDGDANGHVIALSKEGRLKEALHILDLMNHQDIKALPKTYASLLQTCIKLKALAEGKQVHTHIIKSGFKQNMFMENTLVNMYAKCGSVVNARQVFDNMPVRNVVTWTMMIAGYAKHGHAEEAFKLFQQMEWQGLKPDKVTFVSILKACASLGGLQQGKQIHAQIIESGLESDVFVGSTLVDMYAKCGSIECARQVFNRMPKRDVVSWNTLIAGYSHHGYGKEALILFWNIEQEGVKPDKVTFLGVLNACARLGDLAQGKKIHAYITKSGFESDMSVGGTLIDMYAKCGSIELAREVFNKMPKRDVVSWTATIAGYVQHGHCQEALELFSQMHLEGVKADRITFLSVLNACASLTACERGKQIHALIIKSGFESDIFVGNSLVDMYAKCGSIKYAREVFDKMPKRDVVSWNAIIAGYTEHKHGEEALSLFGLMEQEGITPDKVTFLSIVNACASLVALKQGKQIHAYIIRSGFGSDVFVGSALVDMYATCGSIECARQVFDRMPKQDVVLWNAMIGGYAQCGHGEEALNCFRQMEREGVNPDKVTFLCLLNACATLGALEQGTQIHSYIMKNGFELDVSVGSALVDMYVKCRNIQSARQVFNKMLIRNVVAWTAMIAGYAKHGLGQEAHKLFLQMQSEGMKPDKVTFVSILNACASLGALEQGKQIHSQIIKSGFGTDVVVGNALIDMYAKCGKIEDAHAVFCKMPKRDMVSWTALIGGFAQHGHGKEALQLFRQMQQEGMQVDDMTFVGVLSACSHAGLVDEGRHFFDSMSRDYGIIPTAEHYACMVDLLGRAGHLVQADDLINKMPFQPSAVVWMALLGACRIHGNVALAERAAENVLKLEPQKAAVFVLLSNIYSAAGRWDDKQKVMKMMKDRGVI